MEVGSWWGKCFVVTYLILSDPWRSHRDLSRVGILAMMLSIHRRVVGVTRVAIELHVLHAVVVLDELLHINITEVSWDLRPLLVLMMRVCWVC